MKVEYIKKYTLGIKLELQVIEVVKETEKQFQIRERRYTGRRNKSECDVLIDKYGRYEYYDTVNIDISSVKEIFLKAMSEKKAQIEERYNNQIGDNRVAVESILAFTDK